MRIPKGWQKVRLRDVFVRVDRRVHPGIEDVLSITATAGFVQQRDKFSKVIAGKNLEKYILLQKGEFAYNKGNSKSYPQGCVYRLDTYSCAAVPNVYYCFRPKSDSVSSEFYKFYFEAGLLNKELAPLINTGVRNNGLLNLDINEFFGVEILLPPLIEQKKIAEILSTWDRAIETLEKLIEAKTRLRKGLMQKLLTGKVRFKGFSDHWQDYEYGDIFETVSAKKNQISKDKYMVSGKYPVVDQGQSRVVGYTDEECVFQYVPIIVFGDHTRIIKWIDFPFVVGADGTQLLKTKSICEQKYGYYALCHLRLPNLGYSRHFKVVKDSTFLIPKNTSEQKKISMILSCVDRELDCLSGIQERLKSSKQGLMQKLLTGKIRVKI